MIARFAESVVIRLEGLCLDCRTYHAIEATPGTWLAQMSEWEVKHRGHRIEFRTPRRTLSSRLADRWLYPMLDRFGLVPWWLTFAENTNIKLAYASSAAYTLGTASLATSSTFVAGRESTAIDNTTNLYLDYLVGGTVTTGTSPTDVKQINIYAHGSVNDTPTYIDVLDGTDSAETMTSVDILNQLPLLAVLGTNNTSDRVYWMAPKAISLAFGGVVPKFHGLFVSHNTGQNLNATGSNHVMSYTGAYATG